MRSLMLAVGLFASIGAAQQKKPEVPAQNADFTATDITAAPAKPLGEIYLHPPKSKFDCLIEVRMNFNDKLRESVHEI